MQGKRRNKSMINIDIINIKEEYKEKIDKLLISIKESNAEFLKSFITESEEGHLVFSCSAQMGEVSMIFFLPLGHRDEVLQEKEFCLN